MIEKPGIVKNAGSSVVQIMISGIALVVLYRYLLETIGVAQLGVWSLVLAVSSMIQVANFGLTGSIVKNIADYDGRGDKHSMIRAIQTAAITVALLTLALIACAYPGATYYLSFAMEGQSYHDALEVLPLALVAFWILMVTSIYQSGLYGCQLIVQRNGILIAESISHLVLCVLLAPRYGLLGLAYARVAQNVITLLTSMAFLKKHLPELPLLPYQWDRKLFKEMVGYAASFQVISLLVMLSDPVTKALLSRFGSVSMVGYYEMANKLVQLFRSVIVNANQVLVPAFAHLKQLQLQKITELYLRSSHLVVYLALPGFGLLAICAPLVSELVIGRYEPVFVYSTMLLCAGWLANTLAVPAYYACLGTGEMRINIVSHAGMTVLNILLGLTFGQLIGGLGVVMSWAIALGLGGILLNVLYYRKNSIPIASLISGPDRMLTSYCAAGLAVAYVGWLMLPGAWGLLLPIFDLRMTWEPFFTSGMMIVAYIAIISFPMWNHSMRKDLQRWVSGAFERRKLFASSH
jgi:O-antigen/teichoic acid export membrane protein